MSEHLDDADRFLLGGAKSASFPTIGTVVSGTVVSRPEMMQQREPSGELKTWKDGSPMMQLVVTIQTDERDPEDPDDDGERRLFIKSGMKTALQAAIKKAGAKRLEPGGFVTVKYYANGKQETRGFNPPKLYQAEYTPPGDAALAPPAASAPQAAPPQQAAPGGQQAAVQQALAGLDPAVLNALKGLTG